MTVDDGWVADYSLIDFLMASNIPWCAFVPGKIAAARPEWIDYLTERGIAIGNHGYTHHWLTAKTEDEIRDELLKTKELLIKQTGSFFPYFRPPAGQYDSRVLSIAQELGYSMVMWDNDVGGYTSSATVEGQLQSLLERLNNGNIILAHFGPSLHTEEVLRLFIPKAQQMGYEFVTLERAIEDELLY